MTAAENPDKKALARMVDAAERAICAEVCAFMGEPPCWSVNGEWPPATCDEPGCKALAMAAVAAAMDAQGGAAAPDNGDAARDALRAADKTHVRWGR